MMRNGKRFSDLSQIQLTKKNKCGKLSKESKIVSLREEGLSYREIAEIVSCSISTVCYYLDPTQRDKAKLRVGKSRTSLSTYERSIKNRVEAFRKTRTYSKKISKSGYEQIIKSRTKNFKMGQEVENHFTYLDVINKIESNPICYITGTPIDLQDTDSYDFDHIIPRSRGGNSSLDNLGLTTRQANRCKSTLTIEEFVEFCQKVLEHHGFKVVKED